MGTEDGNFTMKHKANLKIARYPSTEGGGYSLAVTSTRLGVRAGDVLSPVAYI